MILGNVTVGQGRIQNVMLVPGPNLVPIRATLDIKTAFQNLPQIIASQAGSLAKGNITISASGNSTVYNGLHIPYYEAVLNNLLVTGEVPLIKLLAGSLQQFFQGNNTLITGLLGAFNGTAGLDQLLKLLLGSSNSSLSTSLLSSSLLALGL
jgi:hypothetical protein